MVPPNWVNVPSLNPTLLYPIGELTAALAAVRQEDRRIPQAGYDEVIDCAGIENVGFIDLAFVFRLNTLGTKVPDRSGRSRWAAIHGRP